MVYRQTAIPKAHLHAAVSSKHAHSLVKSLLLLITNATLATTL